MNNATYEPERKEYSEERFTVGEFGVARTDRFSEAAKALHFEDGEVLFAVLIRDPSLQSDHLVGFRRIPLTPAAIADFEKL